MELFKNYVQVKASKAQLQKKLKKYAKEGTLMSDAVRYAQELLNRGYLDNIETEKGIYFRVGGFKYLVQLQEIIALAPNWLDSSQTSLRYPFYVFASPCHTPWPKEDGLAGPIFTIEDCIKQITKVAATGEPWYLAY